MSKEREEKMQVKCNFYDQDTHELLWSEEGPRWLLAFAVQTVHHEGKNYNVVNAYMNASDTGLDVWVRCSQPPKGAGTEEDK